jgi:PQQ-like domain
VSKRPEHVLVLFAAAGLGLSALVPNVSGETLDPSLPQRRVVGAPNGACAMNRVDGARTGRTRQALPEHPRVLWRARVTGGLDLPPAVDAGGHVVAASPAAQVTEIDRDGKAIFSVKTGVSAPALGPVLTSDGTRMVVTAGGELYAISSNGNVEHRRTLPFGTVRNAVQPLATSDGGAVLASGGMLLSVDSSGGIRARAELAPAPAALIERHARVLVVTQDGDVYEWKPPAEPTKLASFGGKVDEGAALSSPNHVTAVVDHQRVMDLNLTAGTRHVRVESSETLQGPPAILANGETRVASLSGLMLGHDRTGAETTRAALEPPLPGGSIVTPGVANPPPLVVDTRGRVAFARPGLDAGVVLPNGETRSAKGAACGDPAALVPAGPNRMLLACRSGLLIMIGGK